MYIIMVNGVFIDVLQLMWLKHRKPNQATMLGTDMVRVRIKVSFSVLGNKV